MKYELEKLSYAYNALEPVMDAATVEIHYSKHHQAYLNNLNAALEKYPDIEMDIVSLLKHLESLPADIHMAVKNNGGGYYNHSLFWALLTPSKQEPFGNLLSAINAKYGSFAQFQTAFNTAASKHFGSGWAWLVKLDNGSLDIMTLPNQDTPLAYGKPILAIDLWEHAYYLKYQNKRADYLANIWQIINWEFAEKLFNQ